MMAKTGDLVVAVLVYTMRCIEDGDLEVLIKMGFGPAEIAELSELKFADVQRIGRLRSHCLDIKLDKQAFATMIRRIRMDGQSGEWEHVLIRADAPFDMMRRLFGTSNREYTKKRHLFAVSSVGRPTEPDEEMAIKLWHLLTNRIKQTQDGSLTPHDYLLICEESGASLRTVWREAKRLDDN